MIDYAVLTVELETDPNAYGYAALAAAGNDQGQADILNLRRSGITVYRNDVSRGDVIGALSLTDYDALPAARRGLMDAVMRMETLDASNANLRANVLSVFAPGTQTRASLSALAQRTGSRAEQLFGTGARVSHQDVAAAQGRG